jgi:putative chromate ion transporter
LKLGTIGFGGPAAHIALMHNEVVKRRKWMDEQRFLDLLGATYLIPGPNSTEMAIHTGFVRAGWAGLIAGGASFILPAMLIVLSLAWAYTRFGSMEVLGNLRDTALLRLVIYFFLRRRFDTLASFQNLRIVLGACLRLSRVLTCTAPKWRYFFLRLTI